MRTSVVVLGYGEEPYLRDCLDALASQLDEEDELILVDNGILDPAHSEPPGPTLRLGDGTNLGFAGGCSYAASRATGDALVFVNSDAVVRDDAVAALVAGLDDPRTGMVGGCLRLAEDPGLVNSAGNPLQFTGITWAGGCGDPAEGHAKPGPVAVATGGLFAVRREVWDALGGFEPRYFAYHEDTDLSLRCWMAGWTVQYQPSAVAVHHYEFSRNPGKMYLVERNRLVTVWCDYPPRVLAAALPAVVLLEPALLLLALTQGWGRQKLRSWLWLVRNAGWLRRRRMLVQRGVRVDDARIADLMVARIDPPMVPGPPGMGLVNAALDVYWRLARRLIAPRSPSQTRRP